MRQQLCKKLVGTVLGALLVAQSGTVLASPADAEHIVQDAIGTEIAAQKDNAKWQGEKAQILEELRQLKNENMWLGFQEKKYSRYVRDMQGKIAELERVQAELKKIENGLEPFLYEMVENFSAFVKSDLPFLPEERQRRVQFLEQTLDDHSLALGEKLRRVFEAIDAELGYGQSADTQSALVMLDGKETHVTLVRAGRLGLYCLTPDGEHSGIYDKKLKEYTMLPNSSTDAIKHLQNMIDQKRFTELVALPLGGADK
ncbi:DUF3450 domain-containing protein [Desulfobaculum bizertense]|uniref:DUF3450 domain-containing protein n=1 Tax=Desulfobaculum bizertense DSM 18034 TaxID=1121442 RepID=A0A1T4VRR2_9BACT|nr:DUF3450 domain-containing protein [Desulfobaculum bizertense]UIJ38358.1 DUF3450 domain-containing protein [Desulfobaculum bizertense]SKA67663.1 Protein of unknown function [Desulfobaculum bizertense DSM 18034]